MRAAVADAKALRRRMQSEARTAREADGRRAHLIAAWRKIFRQRKRGRLQQFVSGQPEWPQAHGRQMKMKSDPVQNTYARRFNCVLDYIDKHLDDALTVEELSNVANFSKFHFHRQFSEYCGVNIGRYIQLMKLKRASYRLAFNQQDRVIDIALDAGFESPESFSRAFKNVFGQTPTEFRKEPAWASWSGLYRFPIPSRERANKMEVRIVQAEPTMVAVLEHRGAPALLNGSAQRFIEWRRASGLSPVNRSQTYGIAYHDPDTTPADEFRFDICGSVTEAVPDNPHGIVTKTIPGGRCAVARYLGSRDRIGEGVYFLFRNWLPESGEELRDFPVYFHYLNLDHDTPEHEHLTDIYLPLREKTPSV
jgi:AraC family transcriptional regulator